MTDDFVPKPVLPPRQVTPVGVAGNKPAGIQPYELPQEQRPLPWVEATPPDRSDRARRAWETRRANQAAHQLPDRHFTGEHVTKEPPAPAHPYDVVLQLLMKQRAKLDMVIETLKDLKGEPGHEY